jgi:hypothetical protein
MITETETIPKKTPERIAAEKAIAKFNKIARQADMPYYLGFSYGEHLHLYRLSKVWIFADSKEISLIYYDGHKEEFSFIPNGISQSIYNDIEQILEAMDQKWKVKIQEE